MPANPIRTVGLGLVAAVSASLLLLSPLASAAPAQWVPATSLGTGNSAQVNGISCTSSGNCIAVGSLTSGATAWQESAGTWGAPVQLSSGGSARFLDCPAPDSCVAAGFDSTGMAIWKFSGGAWGAPTYLNAPASPSHASYQVSGMSCPTVSTCAVVGLGLDSTGSGYTFQTFVTEEATSWTPQWITLPGGGTNDLGTEISCSSTGNCTVVGGYSAGAFAVTETSGTWGTAVDLTSSVPGATSSRADSVSCGADGSCVAVGTARGSSPAQAFSAELSGGTWTTNLLSPPGGSNSSGAYVSCVSAGNCTLVGDYDVAGVSTTFAITQSGGSWASPVALRQNLGSYNYSHAFTCWSAGNCIWGGQVSSDGGSNFFAVAQLLENGTWGDQVGVADNLGAMSDGQVYAVGCTSDGHCAAGGNLTLKAGSTGHAWVAEMAAQQPSPPTTAGGGSSTLPATGLNLQVPVAVAVLLVGTGAVVATRRRQSERDS